MNIKDLRSKTGLSQKKFGERLGLQGQSILLYEKEERKVPASIQKLIRYEFAKYLPETERLYPEGIGSNEDLSADENSIYTNLKEDFKELQEKYALAANLKEIVAYQKETINSLKDQIQMYKDQLGISGPGNQQTA